MRPPGAALPRVAAQMTMDPRVRDLCPRRVVRVEIPNIDSNAVRPFLLTLVALLLVLNDRTRFTERGIEGHDVIHLANYL